MGAAIKTEDPAEITMPTTITQAKPDSVSPPNSAKGSAEVSTSNYEARKYGVRSGMFIR